MSVQNDKSQKLENKLNCISKSIYDDGSSLIETFRITKNVFLKRLFSKLHM